MLNKEDILALAWEHSEGSGKRYTFTEESLFEFLKELKKEQAPAQDEDIYEGTYTHLCELLAPHTVEAGGRLPASVVDSFRVLLEGFLARHAQTEQQPVVTPAIVQQLRELNGLNYAVADYIEHEGKQCVICPADKFDAAFAALDGIIAVLLAALSAQETNKI